MDETATRSSIFDPRLDFKLSDHIWREDFIDRQLPCEQALLPHVANQVIEDMTVRFDAVRPPVGAKDFA